MKKKMMRFAVLLSLVVLAVAAVPQSAQASCEYPHRITIHYYGWEASGGGYMCQWPNGVGPVYPSYIIGEKVIDCDGSITTWGDTSCDNTTTTVENCPPVCE